MKLMSLLSIAAVLFCATAVPALQPTSEPQPVEGRNKDRKNNKHVLPVNPNPTPEPDARPDDVSPANVEPIEPVEGRVEREARRKKREEEAQRKREQDEIDREERQKRRAERPGLFGWISWIAWGATSWFLWPFSWIFALIKWGGILVLLVCLALFVALCVACFWVFGKTAKWLWGWVD